MKLRGYTDGDDWTPQTFLAMALDRHCWACGTVKDWSLRANYTWYDGPIWQVCIGPFWIAIGPWCPHRQS